MRSVVGAVFVCAAFSFSGNAEARIQVNVVPIPNELPVVVVSGQFDPTDTPTALIQAAVANKSKFVSFDSPGGDIDAAIAFGRAIRQLGLSTVQFRNKECASACSLVFMGGVTRWAEPGSIGVHQSSFSDGSNLDGPTAASRIQTATAKIIGYFTEMGIDPKLLQLSLATPSDDIRYLTAGEMKELNVTTVAQPPEITSPNASSQSSTSPKQDTSSQVGANPPSTAPVTTEQVALAFADIYYMAWSMKDADAIHFLDSIYPDTINFYGKAVSKQAVLSEKIAFAQRWPTRAYSIKPGTARVTCGSVCTITGIAEWFTSSQVRNKQSSGSAEFELTWNPATHKLEGESGTVIEKDKGMSGPDRIVAQWADQNQVCLHSGGAQKGACMKRDDLSVELKAAGLCLRSSASGAGQDLWSACN